MESPEILLEETEEFLHKLIDWNVHERVHPNDVSVHGHQDCYVCEGRKLYERVKDRHNQFALLSEDVSVSVFTTWGNPPTVVIDMKHIPTGLTVSVDATDRAQLPARAEALSELTRKVQEHLTINAARRIITPGGEDGTHEQER